MISLNPSIRRPLALAAVLAGLLLDFGPVRHFQRDRAATRSHVGALLADLEAATAELESRLPRDPSFKPAYGLLMKTLCMAEMVQLWTSLDPQFVAPEGISERLERAYGVAAERVNSSRDLKRLREVEVRRQALADSPIAASRRAERRVEVQRRDRG